MSYTQWIKHAHSLLETLTESVHLSDGVISQYKNYINFLDSCHHGDDYGVCAEQHSSAPSHGKSVFDGIGGTLKSLATVKSKT